MAPLNLTPDETAAATAADTDLDLALGEGTTGYHDLLAAWAHAGEAPYAQDGETAADVRARWKIAFKAVIAALTRRFLRREEAVTVAAADSIPRAGVDGRIDAAWIPAGAGGPAAANAAPPAVGYGTAATGTSAEYARENHGHDLAAHGHTPAEAGADPAGTAAAAVSSHVAASDHPNLSDATPTLVYGAVGQAGGAAEGSRRDHSHQLLMEFNAPQPVGLASSAGASNTPPRGDHVHGHGDLAPEANATRMHRAAQVSLDRAWPGQDLLQGGVGPYDWRNLAQADVADASGSWHLYLRTRLLWHDTTEFLPTAGQVWIEGASTDLPDDAWAPLALLLGWAVDDLGNVVHAGRAFLSGTDVAAAVGKDSDRGTLAFRVGVLELDGHAVASVPRALVALTYKGPEPMDPQSQAEHWRLEWHPAASPPSWWTWQADAANNMALTHSHGVIPELASATPPVVSSSGSSVGVSTKAAREDHGHGHGGLDSVVGGIWPGGSPMHAVAVAGGKPGFMDGAQAAKLSGIEAGAQVNPAGYFDPRVYSAGLGSSNLILGASGSGYFNPQEQIVNLGAWSYSTLYVYVPEDGYYEFLWSLRLTSTAVGRVYAYAAAGAAGYPGRWDKVLAQTGVYDTWVLQGHPLWMAAGTGVFLRITNYTSGTVTITAGADYSYVVAKRVA